MKINNKSFNEWLEKENITYDDNMEEYRTLNGYFSMGVANTSSTTDNELIGLMVQYLLEKRYAIDKLKDNYYVDKNYINIGVNISKNLDLYTCLREAIESIKE